MKFLCGRCHTKYQISDDKVRGKILTIRCKKCGEKIVVRESLAPQDDGVVVAPLADDFDDARRAGARVGGSAAIDRAYDSAILPRASDSDDMPTSIAPVPKDAGLAGYEWYLAVDGQQHGPFAFADLVSRVSGNEVEGRHYVWHDGMSDWTRIRDLPDLANYLNASGAEATEVAPALDDAPPSEIEHNIQSTIETSTATDPELSVASESTTQRAQSKIDDEEDIKTGGLVAAAAPEVSTPVPSDEQDRHQRDEELGDSRRSGREVVAQARRPELNSMSDDTVDSRSKAGSDEDIFANIPRVSTKEVVQREPTKFFVTAAGVSNQGQKARIGMVVGALVALSLVLITGLWLTGVVVVPGVKNPLAGEIRAVMNSGESDDFNAEFLGHENAAQQDSKAEQKASRRKGTSRAKSADGYVDTAANDEGTARRGVDDTSATVSIDSMGGSIKSDGPKSVLPSDSDIGNIPPPDSATLDAASIQRVVATKKKAVRLCYEKSLEIGEKNSGKLIIGLTVRPSGDVARARIKTAEFRRTALGKCLLEKAKSWRFPKFDGSKAQKIELPFIFQQSF